jgi:polyisoprenyl-phosphate glycosyltransferase
VHLVSIIIPVYFNEESLSPLIEKIRATVTRIRDFSFEFIFVDDGSKDGSLDLLRRWRKKDSRIRILKLSRNFGSHSAILAGLHRAKGSCHIIIGADLQDPPEIIPRFLEQWKKGNKIVVGIREKRRDPLLTTLLANVYYAIMKISFKNMPKKGFDIFLIDDQVRLFLLNIGSRNMSLVVSILWSGYSTMEVPYTRRERPFGKSRWGLFRRIKLSVDSLIAYSYMPILFLFLSGTLLTIITILFLLHDLTLDPSPQEIQRSLLVCMFGITLNALGLAVLGEYLWRNLEETRRFPSFIVEEEIGFKRKS